MADSILRATALVTGDPRARLRPDQDAVAKQFSAAVSALAARTGSGKTTVSLVNCTSDTEQPGRIALYFAPTRALVQSIALSVASAIEAERVFVFSSDYGSAEDVARIRFLLRTGAAGVVIVATPDQMLFNWLLASAILGGRVKVVILDEVHQILLQRDFRQSLLLIPAFLSRLCGAVLFGQPKLSSLKLRMVSGTLRDDAAAGMLRLLEPGSSSLRVKKERLVARPRGCSLTFVDRREAAAVGGGGKSDSERICVQRRPWRQLWMWARPQLCFSARKLWCSVSCFRFQKPSLRRKCASLSLRFRRIQIARLAVCLLAD